MDRDALRQLLGQAAEAALDTLADGLAAAAPADGPVRMMPPDQIRLDPARFQFRCDAAGDGTTGRLRARQWHQHLAGALLCWVDPADGAACLVDGHHRLALSRRCQVPEVAVLLLQARDAREARLQGAAANIAAGQADAPEVARWLAAGGSDLDELERLGVGRRSRLLADARRLQALCPSLLAQVCRGVIPEAMGLALAAAGEAATQRDLWREATRRGWDAPQVAEAASLATMARVSSSEAVGCLPGLEAMLASDSSDLGALLSIRAEIRRQLSTELRALRAVAHRRSAAALEAAEVAVIDVAGAAEARDATRATARLFGQLAHLSGPLQTLIRALADEVAAGQPAAVVVAEHLPRIREALDAELSFG